ncbi:MAG: EutN/CcmL family microcompartment protein [candidate division KSB1 bacterium]
MILARVIGTVWATRKDERLHGLKFQIVRPVDLNYKDREGYLVAIDAVGAGVGEIVMVVQGSSARQTKTTENKPVDATIMAIIDKLDVA